MKLIILLLAGSRGLQLQHPLLLHKRILRTPTIRSSHLLSSRVSSDGDGQEEKCKASTPITKSKVNKTTVASQAALIAGTTIGGGFTTLPAATAPCGFFPSALGLVGVWTYLLGCSLSFANAIFLMKKNRTIVTTHDNKSDSDDDIISIFSLVRKCFGNTAGVLTGLLFLLLIKATLVAQLSKVGVLLEEIDILNLGLHRGLCTILFSSIVATTCLVGKQRSIERINDVLTSTMLLSFASVVALASRSGWSLDGLNHINYKSLFPSVGGGESPWVVPIFIQLLLYNEVVPLISDRLGDEKKVRRAILFGSSVPLLMCLIWTCIALGIVPYDPSLFDCRSSNAIYDPLSRLGERVLTKGGSIGKLFLASVNIMAGSAICTTVFGSILATIQYLDDVIANSFGARRGRNNRISKIAKHAFAIIPSVCVAVLGSKELYYHATAFAGRFPCTFLFGLIPPLCNLRLRWAQKEQGETIRLKHVTSQVLLATVSAAILAVCSLSKQQH